MTTNKNPLPAAGEDSARRDDADRTAQNKRKLDRALDSALADSFPSSDPPAISQPQKPGSAGDHGRKRKR
jgi:hypothetical protein